MSSMLSDTMGTAEDVMESAYEAVSGLIATLRKIHVEDALGWIGLERRRSSLASMGIFGAGAALGAVAGVLFARMADVERRRRVLDRFIEGEPREVGNAAKELAGKTRNLAIAAAHRAIDRAAAISH